MNYIIQGHTLTLTTILLDLNGTTSVHGKVPRGVAKRIRKLKQQGFSVLLITGDQRGDAAATARKLDCKMLIAKNSEEKAKIARQFTNMVAIGNARIDYGLFMHAQLAIATLQAEGIHADIINHVDIIVPSIIDALDLLLIPTSLVGTMKE